MSIKNLKSTGILKRTGDTNLDLISQVPSEWIPFQLKKIHLNLRVRACLVRTMVRFRLRMAVRRVKGPPLGFGEREHHQARHRLLCPLTDSRLCPLGKVPKDQALLKLCQALGSWDGLDAKAPSPTLTYLLPLLPLTCLCPTGLPSVSLNAPGRL